MLHYGAMHFTSTDVDINTIPKMFRGAFLRLKKHRSMSMRERFEKRVQRGEKDECWLWLGQINYAGYGIFSPAGISGGRGDRAMAHRVAWELENGPIPKGKVICHKCDNPPCCNFNHLFCGTQLDNVKDCISKGRNRGPCGEKSSTAKLTSKEVLVIREIFDCGLASTRELTRMFGMSYPNIRAIVTRKNWRHI